MHRSKAMWLVGYFLSRYGDRRESGVPAPPVPLGVNAWNRAYAMFFRHLGEGRTLVQFANSLKNARDTFDGHMASGRVGWRREGRDRAPAALPREASRVLREWESRGEQELWGVVSRYSDPDAGEIPDRVLLDLLAETDPASQGTRVRTEGGKRAVVKNRIERDPSLRHAALRIHGCRCQVCGFSFEETYGRWGAGFAIVHHLRLLADGTDELRDTDAAVDLAVLCANCHCMIHRRRNTVLTLSELQAKLVRRSGAE